MLVVIINMKVLVGVWCMCVIVWCGVDVCVFNYVSVLVLCCVYVYSVVNEYDCVGIVHMLVVIGCVAMCLTGVDV